ARVATAGRRPCRLAAAPRSERNSRTSTAYGRTPLPYRNRSTGGRPTGAVIVLVGDNRPHEPEPPHRYGHRRRAVGCSCGWRRPDVIVPPMLPIAACGRPSEIPVERVPAVTTMDFERRYRRASQPVVFTDLIPKWKAW